MQAATQCELTPEPTTTTGISTHHPQQRWHPSPHGSIPAWPWAHANVLPRCYRALAGWAEGRWHFWGAAGTPNPAFSTQGQVMGTQDESAGQSVTLREQHGVPAALGAHWSSTVTVSPPPWTPHAHTHAHSRCSPRCIPAMCPPQWLMPSASGPQMGAVALDLLTPAGCRQQARCT